jgi:hypothetical protein
MINFLADVVTDYGLGGWCLIPGEGNRFSLLNKVHTDSEAQLAFCQMGTELKLSGRGADCSPPSGADVNNIGAVPTFPYSPSYYGV